MGNIVFRILLIVMTILKLWQAGFIVNEGPMLAMLMFSDISTLPGKLKLISKLITLAAAIIFIHKCRKNKVFLHQGTTHVDNKDKTSEFTIVDKVLIVFYILSLIIYCVV